MLFLVWLLIDFMILCRGGERDQFIVFFGVFCSGASLHTAARIGMGQAHMLMDDTRVGIHDIF